MGRLPACRYVPLGLAAWFADAGVSGPVVELDWWESARHPGTRIDVTFTPAQVPPHCLASARLWQHSLDVLCRCALSLRWEWWKVVRHFGTETDVNFIQTLVFPDFGPDQLLLRLDVGSITLPP